MSAARDLLLALRDCELSARAGAVADKAVLGAALRFRVSPDDLRAVWLRKEVGCAQARATLAAER